MQRFGFWKFCLFSLVMLAVVTLAFRLLKFVYQSIFGGPLPPGLVYFLLRASLVICLASFAYRYSYEGVWQRFRTKWAIWFRTRSQSQQNQYSATSKSGSVSSARIE